MQIGSCKGKGSTLKSRHRNGRKVPALVKERNMASFVEYSVHVPLTLDMRMQLGPHKFGCEAVGWYNSAVSSHGSGWNNNADSSHGSGMER